MISGGSTQVRSRARDRQVGGAHHQEQSDERRLAFPEHDGTPPDDDRVCGARGRLEPIALILGEHAGKDTTRGEVRARRSRA